MFKKVAVGISGGVDSAVSALLLKSKGYEVIGVFMKNWDIVNETGECLIEKDFLDAEYVCRKLEIPLIKVDFVKEYWNDVFSYVLSSYESGNTPNPDIHCNRSIKFDAFLKYAQEKLNADAIATGHYVNTSFGKYLQFYKQNTNVSLLRALDLNKDQTFFLSRVQQEALRKCMFPLAQHYKQNVKKIAEEAGLIRVAVKRESVGMCFIGKRKFKDFIGEYIEDNEGEVVDIKTGKVISKHNGIHQWTLGQNYKIGGMLEPFFICRKDLQSNTIYVCQGTTHPALYSDFVISNDIHWINKEPNELASSRSTFHCDFLFQHRNSVTPCTVYKTASNNLLIKIDEPLRAMTPGQYAVLYYGNECLGSSEIKFAGPSYYMQDKDIKFSSVKKKVSYQN